MSIQSNISGEGSQLTIKVKGRFDFSVLQEFRNAYEDIDTNQVDKYIIDLEESDYLDSSALGMLLALRDFAGGESANIIINNCKPDVKKILVITKLDELFDIV